MDIQSFKSTSNALISRGNSIRSSRNSHEDDEEALKWAALERLPTYERARKGILHGIAGDFKETDLTKLGYQEKKDLLDSVINSVDDNEQYLNRLKKRIDRVSLDLPTIEVQFENLEVEAEIYVGSRALPSILNFYRNMAESVLNYLHIRPNKKKRLPILRDISGIIKPGRITLLLGPPASGKSTLLQALSGKLDKSLKFSGKVTYNGHEMNEFEAPRTSAYISQYDVHLPLLTVRETLTFSARCQGVGTGYEMLTELLRREKQLNITPDPYIDALMKASVVSNQKEDMITAYVLRILDLEVCADTIVGDDMTRGISGGQKKRVTTGEMIVGPVNALFMDNISTGLDSSTTFQIINSIKQSIHIFSKSALISLLQPPPETFELFDDVILLAEGHIVYQGPREHVLEFFESVGFRCPQRKGVADYLQEVTSKKDQRQYWFDRDRPYRYISVEEFAQAFKSFHVGQSIQGELAAPFDRSKSHRAALTRSKYGAKKTELMKACLAREVTLLKRNIPMIVFKIVQSEICALVMAAAFSSLRSHHHTTDDGLAYLGAIFFVLNTIAFSGFLELPIIIEKLPIFYKQRDHRFFPTWAFSLPASTLGIPVSLAEVFLYVATLYYSIGFDTSFIRMLRHWFLLTLTGQMSFALFRCIGAVTRDNIVANTAGCVSVLWILILSGFILSKDSMPKWLVWGYWTSPLMYTQTGLSVNEFLGKRWSQVVNGSNETLAVAVLKLRGVPPEEYWYWISIVAMIGFVLLFNGVTALALAYLDEYGKSQAAFIPEETPKENHANRAEQRGDDELQENEASTSNTGDQRAINTKLADNNYKELDSLTIYDSITKFLLGMTGPTSTGRSSRRGMVLPFTPLCLTFDNITYSVDMPKAMKDQGVSDERLVLLKEVSGSFRPGVLTALMGVSGAGKTTLLDVLSGRKNSGKVEGSIKVSGYPKKQETFARVTGYCEQNDIHSPLVTVYESLLFSAWLRLPAEVTPSTREHFVEEVMELVELTPLRNALVGRPNVNGLSIEQRKRLTIAVELVANPSIIFMDEPTSGLDARAAAIVMRTVRNTVDTGRTVVCTIHQPSVDIFESFDELFLLTRGGEEIYVGPIGPQSRYLIEYFEKIQGVGKIKDGYNPATWALEVTTGAKEDIYGVKFADVYKNSDLYRRNKALIEELSIAPTGSQDLHFPFKYSQSYYTQFKACLWKQNKQYWRNTPYNGVRLIFSLMVSIMFGFLFWNIGSRKSQKTEVLNALGSMYMSINFLGGQSASTVRPVTIEERVVFYRERAAGMYSAFPYALAQLASEVPYTAVQVAIYGIIVYAMMGFEWTASKFLLNMFFMFLTVLYFIYYGMAIIAVSLDQAVASILNGVFYTLWNLCAGFAIPTQRIVEWLRWFVWLNPEYWSLYGVAAVQYADDKTKLDSGETVSEYMREYFGFKYDLLWVVSVWLIAFNLLLVLVYTISMKVLVFQKR